jgi:type I restriction enzyme M protein
MRRRVPFISSGDMGLWWFSVASGLSTSRKEEKEIREGIINADKLDCVVMLPDKLFTNTGISACIWFLTNDKTDSRFRDRRGETLFIDCRGRGKLTTRTLRELSKAEIEEIAGTYQKWRSKDWDGVIPEGVSNDPGDPPDDYDGYRDIRGFCKSVTTAGEITEHEYIVVPGRYVGAPPLPDDGEPFEEKMERLTKELGEHFAESRRLEDEIRKNLGDLGFDF